MEQDTPAWLEGNADHNGIFFKEDDFWKSNVVVTWIKSVEADKLSAPNELVL